MQTSYEICNYFFIVKIYYASDIKEILTLNLLWLINFNNSFIYRNGNN